MNTPTDGRTRAGHEMEVRRQVRNHGGFSVFWVTANKQRAAASVRLQDRGEMVVTPDQYPWSKARLTDE